MAGIELRGLLPGGLIRRGSRADLPSVAARPLAALRGFAGAARGPGPAGAADLPWSVIVRSHLADYLALAALLAVVVVTEHAPPYPRSLAAAAGGDGWWRYSFPLKVGAAQRVPAPAVLVLGVGVPLFVLLAHALLARPPRAEAHAAFLALAAAVLTTGTATNLLKLGVGRPRPNFVARCWPGGATPVFDDGGVPVCAPGAVGPWEGRKSFPSGHSSWCSSGLGFISFWAAGKLRVWTRDAAGHPARLILASLPLSLAVFVGVTRLQDNWHHVEDVAVGLALGTGLAYAAFRQSYHCFTSHRAGEPYVAALAAAAAVGGSGVVNGGASGSGAGPSGSDAV